MARQILIVVMLSAALCHAGDESQKKKDLELGNAVDAMLRDTYVELDDSVLRARIAEVGTKVVKASGNPQNYDFRFRVLNDANPNAFSTAGGYVYVTSALLQTMASEDELAAVLAHEVAHINNRDPCKPIGLSRRQALFWTIAIGVSSQVAAVYVSQAVADALGPATDPGMSMNIARSANQMGGLASTIVSDLGNRYVRRIVRGFGPKREMEADSTALEYTAAAGYHPKALERVIARLLQISRDEAGPKAVVFLHTSRKELLGRYRALRGTPQ